MDMTIIKFACVFRSQKMYAIRILAKIVELVFQLTHLMTANACWDGQDHTVKVSAKVYLELKIYFCNSHVLEIPCMAVDIIDVCPPLYGNFMFATITSQRYFPSFEIKGMSFLTFVFSILIIYGICIVLL